MATLRPVTKEAAIAMLREQEKIAANRSYAIKPDHTRTMLPLAVPPLPAVPPPVVPPSNPPIDTVLPTPEHPLGQVPFMLSVPIPVSVLMEDREKLSDADIVARFGPGLLYRFLDQVERWRTSNVPPAPSPISEAAPHTDGPCRCAMCRSQASTQE